MSVLKYVSTLTVCSVFAALMSIVWQAFWTLKKLNLITTVLTVLLSIEAANRNTRTDFQPKIAIAYGACSDLLVNGVDFLNYTEILWHNKNVGQTDEITNLNELLQNFGYYFENGAAAERFVSNKTLFNDLIATAKRNHRDSIKWFLGSNAALMGMRFFEDGAKVLLGARMSKKLQRFVPPALQITGEPLDEDEIHLILEYKAGDKWGNLTAPRANRFILHSDRYNPQLQVAEKFGEALKEFQPNLFVVTGLHVMDKYKFEPGIREARLLKVREQLTLQPATTLAHFEMASYVDIELILMICEHILPYVDSIGMNEQELSNLVDVFENGKIAAVSDWNPDIAVTLDQTRQIYSKFVGDYFANVNDQSTTAKRLLSRLHVHTLAYQIILTKKDAQWKSGKAAVAKASLVAHRYVCQTDMVNPESATLLLPDKFYTSLTAKKQAITLDPHNPVTCWQEFIEIPNENAIEVEICISPVLVCRIAKKAAGAGDNISAAALFQQFNSF